MNQARLDGYLADLDRALGPIAVGDRAEIILEIKSHVLDAIGNDPTQSMDAVLAGLGEPEQVANRYLLERGLKPKPAPKRSIAKWLVIGMLGTMSLAVLSVALLVWKFTPLVEVDEAKGRVRLLGGLVDVSDLDGAMKLVGSVNWGEGVSFTNFKGSKTIANPESFELSIPFTNGKFEVSTAEGATLSWDCKASFGSGSAGEVKKDGSRYLLDLKATKASKCDLSVPSGMKVALVGNNGKVEIHEPRFPVEVKLDNGKIDFSPEPSRAYHFNTSVVNGKLESFESSDAKDAIKVSLAVTNGNISRR